MKKFSFKLQSILKYREFLRDEAQLELAKAISEESAIENEIKDIAVQHVRVKEQSAGSTNFYDILNSTQYFSFLEDKKEELLQDLAEAQIVSDQKREVMQEAMKEVKSLEKMRARRLETWHEEALREEELLADEINSGKRYRR